MRTQVTRLGILGSGQLGRMLTLAAAPLGIKCSFFDEAIGSPCLGLGHTTVGSFRDEVALKAFAKECDVVTYEFENVPFESARAVESVVRVHPSPLALEVSQDRVAEKNFFQRLSIPTPAFAAAASEAALLEAIALIGTPCVVKTCRMGYDGKGQEVVRVTSDAVGLWSRLGEVPLIIEEFLTFDRELSVIAARGTTGDVVMYPLAYNIHNLGILRRSEMPAPNCSEALIDAARAIVTQVLSELDYVGVLAIELFEAGGKLFANEMAPRVHNSGHGTMDGCVCSQFENHVRAVSGLPLGRAEASSRVVMLNLIGSLPPTQAMASLPFAKIHLYGKDPRPGRKVGHINLLDPTNEDELVATRLIEQWQVSEGSSSPR